MKIKQWPNRLGYDIGQWECLKRINNVGGHVNGFLEVRKFKNGKEKLPYLYGVGMSIEQAMLNAEKIEN